jgi:hypothetical protein
VQQASEVRSSPRFARGPSAITCTSDRRRRAESRESARTRVEIAESRGVANAPRRKSVWVWMSYTVAMASTFARALLVLATLGAVSLPADAGAAESRRGALVRVEVIEDETSRVQTKAVWWDGTANVSVDVGGHNHEVAVTPSQRDRGFALAVDHKRDGTMVADDEKVATTGRKVVLKHGETRIVVTVVPTTMHVAVE